MKKLSDISLPITEEEYRSRPELSYSILAKYERGGFNNLNTLFDRIETPSLTFGSMVDEMITGSMDSFNEKFIVSEFPTLQDSIIPIVKSLFESFNERFSSLSEIPDVDVIARAAEFNFQNNWKPETRARVIKEKAEEYYNLLYLAKGKTIVSSNEFQDACDCVGALRTSQATKWYFSPDNPFEKVERYYQLKFAATFNNIGYRIMMDLVVVDYDNKIIYPVDLKTSSKAEWDFYKSFIDWNYSIQSRLYFRVLKANLEKDPYFKDFTVMPYRFIVVNRRTKTPLVWEFSDTAVEGDLYYGKNKQIELRDPFIIGSELSTYLEYECNTPIGIEPDECNNIIYWLNKL